MVNTIIPAAYAPLVSTMTARVLSAPKPKAEPASCVRTVASENTPTVSDEMRSVENSAACAMPMRVDRHRSAAAV